MQITALTVGPVATCCYVLSRENGTECIVIDPGAEPERVRKAAGGKRIAAILLTHGHFDHIGAVSALKDGDTPVLVHALDAPMLGDPELNVSRLVMRRDVTAPPATDLLQEGSRRTLAGLDIEVLFRLPPSDRSPCPGHSLPSGTRIIIPPPSAVHQSLITEASLCLNCRLPLKPSGRSFLR